jgi:hypothetical protein
VGDPVVHKPSDGGTFTTTTAWSWANPVPISIQAQYHTWTDSFGKFDPEPAALSATQQLTVNEGTWTLALDFPENPKAGDDITVVVTGKANYPMVGPAGAQVTVAVDGTAVPQQNWLVSTNAPCTIDLGALPAGNHKVVVTSVDNGLIFLSTSVKGTVFVHPAQPAATQISLSDSAPVVSGVPTTLTGEPFTLTAYVSSQLAPPTGTVALTQNGYLVAWATVLNDPNQANTSSVQFSIPGGGPLLPAGNYEYVVTYRSDSPADFLGSSTANNPLQHTVTAIPAVSIKEVDLERGMGTNSPVAGDSGQWTPATTPGQVAGSVAAGIQSASGGPGAFFVDVQVAVNAAGQASISDEARIDYWWTITNSNGTQVGNQPSETQYVSTAQATADFELDVPLPADIAVGKYSVNFHFIPYVGGGDFQQQQLGKQQNVTVTLYAIYRQNAYSSDAGLQDNWPDGTLYGFATQWGSGTDTATVLQHLMDGIYNYGKAQKWSYVVNGGGARWRQLLGDGTTTATSGCSEDFAETWQNLSLVLGVPGTDIHSYPGTGDQGFVTTLDCDLFGNPNLAGNAHPTVGSCDRWMFDRYVMGYNASTNLYYDVMLDKLHESPSEIVQWNVLDQPPQTAYKLLGRQYRLMDNNVWLLTDLTNNGQYWYWAGSGSPGAAGTAAGGVGAAAAAAAKAAAFSGSPTFQPLNTGGDGTYDALAVNVKVNVTTPGTYAVNGWLLSGSQVVTGRASQDDEGGSSVIITAKSRGTQNVTLQFSGEDIYQSGVDGPLTADLWLLNVKNNSVVLAHGDFSSPSYVHTQFGEEPLRLSGVTDQGVDPDAGGKFDLLSAAATVNVTAAGDYTLEAQLYSAGGRLIVSASQQQQMAVGAATVDVGLPGTAISAAQLDGPYRLVVSASDSQGNQLSRIEETTQSYHASDFDTDSFSGIYSDSGIDTNGDGLFDQLAINVGLNVGTAGNYVVAGSLCDHSGNVIDSRLQPAALAAGAQSVTLNFLGTAIRQSGADGPYVLTNLTLSPAGGVAAAAVAQAYTTSSYHSTDFGPAAPTVTVSPAAGQPLVTTAGTVDFTAVFSEPESEFSGASLSLGGTAGATTVVVTPPAGPATTYDITVSGMTQTGTVTVTIPQGAVFGANGQPNAAATSGSVMYDVTPPTADLADPTDNGWISLTALNARKYIDVAYSDVGSGINTASITGNEFVLAGPGATGVSLSGTPAILAGNIVRYYFTGSFSEGPVMVQFKGGTVADQAGNTLAAVTRSFTVKLVSVVDDSNTAAFKTTGAWTPIAGQGYDGGAHSSLKGGGQNTAAWTFAVAPGQYRVAVTWPASSTAAAKNAPFAIYDGSKLLGTVAVNQTTAPAGFTDLGVGWKWLNSSAASGAFQISGQTLVVKLTNKAGGTVIADAVRVEHVAALPDMHVLNGKSEVARGGAIDFGTSWLGIPVSKTLTVKNEGTATLNLKPLGAPDMPAGFALVSSYAKTALAPGQSTTFALQFLASSQATASGQLSLATSDGKAMPFNLQLQGTVQTTQIVDDSDGLSMRGTWTVHTGAGFKGEYRDHAAGGGANTVAYAFNVPPGYYKVAATWPSGTTPTPASNAAYLIFDGTKFLNVAFVDQRTPPADFSDQGASWAWLTGNNPSTNPGVFQLTAKTLTVMLTDQADGDVLADAVYIERVPAPAASAAAKATAASVAVTQANDRQRAVAAAVQWWSSTQPASGQSPAADANKKHEPAAIDTVYGSWAVRD